MNDSAPAWLPHIAEGAPVHLDLVPRAVQSYLDGRLNQMENRMASLLFKQAVELDMGLSMLFKCVNVSEEELRRQRAESVANVKKANGKVSLVQKLRELEDDPWQD